MKRLALSIPEGENTDPEREKAIRAMKRIVEIGIDAWLAEEIAAPSWTDPGWCRMVTAWAGQRALMPKPALPPAPAGGSPAEKPREVVEPIVDAELEDWPAYGEDEP